MPDQKQLAENFRELHKPGEPVVLYNIWDPGSALAVHEVGARAIATGSHGVANAWGYEDGEKIPFEEALKNTQRIVELVDLPVTMDIETGYGQTPADVTATVKKVVAAGVVGINIEDQLLGQSNVRDIAGQVDRIAAARSAAEETGVRLFINARSDIFRLAEPKDHNSSLLEQAIQRAKAYAEAGADGFFLPGISDSELIRELCQQCPVPVNIIMLPGVPSTQELAAAGVARISYGPIPYLQMIDWLKEKARAALGAEE